ncbi:MAG: hypothetical protein IJY47_01080 [Clostridia bacterium]|nr:hypothetical protein [Clostridia bacterium]
MKRSWMAVFALGLAVILSLSLFGCRKTEDNEASGGHFSVQYKGVTLEIGQPAEEVLKALSDPVSKKEIGDCGGLGAQVRYDYSSLILYVLESKDGAVIDQITLTDDLVATEKGICIGDSQDKVKEAYGNVIQSDGSRLVYTSGDNQLIFEIKDGKVSGIDLMQITQ